MAAKCFVGVDIGGTHVRIVRAAEAPPGLGADIVKFRTPDTVDELVEKIVGHLPESAGAPRGVGIGLAGRVTESHAVWVPALPQLNNVPLSLVIAERLDAPCGLINDAQATLLAEARSGAARGCRDALLVAVGTGIGGAILAGGQVVRGATGTAGAFGWLPVRDQAGTPEHGPWETLASGRALSERARDWTSVERLVHEAQAGDPRAESTLADYAAHLGVGIASLVRMIDPEVVVFAGGLVAAFDTLRSPLVAAMSRAGLPSVGGVPLVPAAHGAMAGVVGALTWAQERWAAEPVEGESA